MILRRLQILSLLIVVIPACLSAASVAGDWTATLEAGPRTLRLALHVAEDSEGALSATMDSLDQQGATGLEIDTMTLEGDQFAFRMNRLMADYSGTVSEDGKSIEGTWTQGPNSLPLRFERVAEGALPAGVYDDASLERLAGVWSGRLAVGNTNLRVEVHVVEEAARYRVTLVSPDQGNSRLPVSAISVAGDAVEFAVARNGGSYEGTLRKQGDSIEGTWTQSGFSFPLSLARASRAP